MEEREWGDLPPTTRDLSLVPIDALYKEIASRTEAILLVMVREGGKQHRTTVAYEGGIMQAIGMSTYAQKTLLAAMYDVNPNENSL